MTSLSEVYEGGVRTVVDRRQRWLGMSLFAVGAGMVITAITLATTDLSSWFGFSVTGARLRAGVLAGVGLPAAFIGIFVVLPASNATRAAATIGASLSVFGVALFTHAYPDRWISTDPTMALGTIAVYAGGTLLTFWCLFIAIATFKTRNDPGGTARVELTEEGRVRVINAGPGTETPSGSSPSIPGFGSVGLFGSSPDGTVPTQTNDETRSSETRETNRSTTSDQSGTDDIVIAEPTSDGGSAIKTDGETTQLEAAATRGQPDSYCGNCTHFEYVRADGEIKPYCGLDGRVMEDMDACREWEQRETDSLPR